MTGPLIALAGNPNTGKSTLFNAWTQSRAKVGNYPGVTVERKTAEVKLPKAGEAQVVDIPGTYSLVCRTAEERIAVDALVGTQGCKRPDVAVVCVDATKLARGLYLVLQVQELGVPVVVAVTMNDEVVGPQPDCEKLADALGCPVVAVVAPKHRGIDELGRAVDRVLGEPGEAVPWRWSPSTATEGAIAAVMPHLPETWPKTPAMALWALMSIDDDDELTDIPAELRDAVNHCGADGYALDDEAVQGRYRWIDSLGSMAAVKGNYAWTERVDRVLLHRVSGLIIFLAIMFVVFQALFTGADPAIGLIEEVFGWSAKAVERTLGPGLVTDFITGGIIAGVGSVLVFLPQILLLFLIIGFMESSGYMARVAYLMDRIMKSMNLHGRAFVPMLSGFACAVPAILATRTLERRRDRLLTMMVVPLMTCSARLPVYTLLIASLFPASKVGGIFPIQGLLLVCMYVFSIVVALIAAWVMSHTIKPLRARRLPFVVELPPYRMPRLGAVVQMMWQRSAVFLKEAGTVIMVCTVVLWALLYFPRQAEMTEVTRMDTVDDIARVETARVGHAADSEQLRNSYGGRLGRMIEPAIAPLGFDWKIGIGIIGAFAAREVFISTMGVVYSVGEEVDEQSATLRQHLRGQVRADGTRVYTPLVGLSLMVFFALACQCMSTLAVVKRETGGYMWPSFLFAYMTVLAWLASFGVYQGGRLLGFV